MSFMINYLQVNFKDINGLVEQNTQLRSLVRRLSDQIESREAELKVSSNLFYNYLFFVSLIQGLHVLDSFSIINIHVSFCYQENFEEELQKRSAEAASRVDAVLARAEEQQCMIESLHGSVSIIIGLSFGFWDISL